MSIYEFMKGVYMKYSIRKILTLCLCLITGLFVMVGCGSEQSKQEPSAPVEIIPTAPSPKLEETKPLAVSAQEPQTVEAPVVQDQLLPETGEQSNWWISLLGMLMMFLTLVGIREKKDDHRR